MIVMLVIGAGVWVLGTHPASILLPSLLVVKVYSRTHFEVLLLFLLPQTSDSHMLINVRS